jgi:hypothetical protein
MITRIVQVIRMAPARELTAMARMGVTIQVTVPMVAHMVILPAHLALAEAMVVAATAVTGSSP